MFSWHRKNILSSQRVRYALSLVLFGLALVCRLAFLPVEDGLAFLTFYPGLTIVFLLCGIGPGAAYTVLSAAAGFYIFTPPHWSWEPNWPGVLATAAYFFSAGLIAILIQRVNRAFDASEFNRNFADHLYTSTPAMLHSIDAKGRLLKVSDFWLKTLGYERHEVLGLLSSDFLTQESKDFAKNIILPRFFETGVSTNVPYQMVCKDGRILDVLLSAGLERDEQGRPMYSLASIVDVTDKKKAEQAQASSEARYKALVEDQTELVSLSDFDGGLRFVNEAYAKHYGSSVTELVGTSLYDFIPELERPNVKAHLANVFRSGVTSVGVNATVSTIGDTRWVAWTNRVVTDVDGVGLLLHSVGRDVTEQRATELALLQSKSELAELNVQLEQRTKEAEMGSASKGQFLANMSHEIRTPMNAILGLLSLLQSTALTSQQRDYASKTEGAAQSLLGLLNDILDFSKVEAGKLELESEHFRIDKLLRNLSVVLSANVGNKNLEVLFDIDPDLPVAVKGDSMRLQQVLINLGGNAVKFTSRGHVVLALRKLAQTEYTVTIEFTVQDTGIGIEPKHQAHIFTGFSQAEGSTTRRFGGTGLGLAISKRLVEMMGGDIQISSKPGEGSTFSFVLEMPTLTDVPQELAVPERHTLPAQRVLVVDDNPIAGELTLRMVRSWGWSATLARSGTQALEAVSAGCTADAVAFPYPMIYMGWQLSDMDGWEATRRIRELAQRSQRAQPTVIMVATHGREILAQCTIDEQNTINGILVKPVTASMLYEAFMEAGSGNAGLRVAAKGRSNARQLRGMRILVVEDNLINQQVADELLTVEGAIVSLAANGQIGVDAVAAAAPQFDVVLMDVQMPVLDGYGATKAIRDDLGLARLPIIAMTANAMDSDREACIAAGMNEHIGKPFDIGKLVSLLIRVTGFQNETGSEHSISNEGPSSLPDVAGLDIKTALGRMSGLRGLYVRTARDFIKIMDTVVPEIEQCIAKGDQRSALMRLHTLKGNAGTLGAMDLAAIAAKLEVLCKSDAGMAVCSQGLKDFSILVKNTQQSLRDAIARLDQAPAVNYAPALNEPSKAVALTVLRKVSALAAASDMDALMCFAEGRASLSILPDDFTDRLDQALQDINLAAASMICEEMLHKLRVSKFKE